MRLFLRRTLVRQEERQQGKEAIGNELFVIVHCSLFIVHCSLFIQLPNVQVSDTTGDAQRTDARQQNFIFKIVVL